MKLKRVGMVGAVLGIIYLLTLGVIYIVAPDPGINGFPKDCPPTPNCTRVADFNVRGEGLKPMLLNASLNDVHTAIVFWIEDQPRSAILFDNGTFIHAKFMSLVFRFPDDMYIRLFCIEGKVSFWVQSQARLGRSDLNVNEKRVQSLFSFVGSFQFEEGSCGGT